jgi:hypothetical protein
VYYYFRRWNRVQANGFTKIDNVLMTLENYEVLSVRDINPSMLIGDSKSVQNADTAEEKGYDGAKKNPG